jgi:glycosyltransferase involved in cell wall biosynthesis
MAAFNAAATIDHAIASVLAQSRRDFELIVIDDGSTDETATLVSAYASADRRVRLHRQENAGPANARNVGIELARGRYVSILDSDDLWLPDYLELMVGALEGDAEAAFAYTRAWVMDVVPNKIRRETWPVRLPSMPPGADALLHALILENFVYSSTTIRRDVLSRVGGYDPWVGVAEDYELWLRIAAAGGGAVAVRQPLVVRCDRPDSLTKDDLAMCAGKRRAFERLLARRTLSVEARALAEQGLTETERARKRLAGERRPTRKENLRRAAGLATRPLRQRLNRRLTPPADVASAFPGLGTGGRAGLERVTIDGPHRAAARA